MLLGVNGTREKAYEHPLAGREGNRRSGVAPAMHHRPCGMFYRSSNAIFGKVGKHASEEVTLQLVKSKCMPMLRYGLECFALLKSDVKSIDFAVTRFLMKLFRTSSIDVINDCTTNFSFMLPSEMIKIRKAKFEIKFNTCSSLRYYFGL